MSDPIAYRHTDAPEPHRRRRAAILRAHPEIPRLFGYDPRPVWRMAGAFALQLAIAYGFSRAGEALSVWITAPALIAIAWCAGAVLNHYGGVVIHEASHNLCARTERQNRWIAIFANLPKVLPYAMAFRRHHLTHHEHMGVRGIDNDLPFEFERKLIGNGPARKLVWLFFYPFFGALCRGFLVRPDRWELLQWCVQLPFNVMLWLAFGWWGLAYLMLSTWFSASLHPIAAHFIHEHYLWDEGQETYSYYGPLNSLTENLGYHVEHHDFVAIPGSRLPELHAMAREFYAPLVSHRSWTRILATFVLERRLSHGSRFVRADRRGAHDHPATCWVEPSASRQTRSEDRDAARTSESRSACVAERPSHEGVVVGGRLQAAIIENGAPRSPRPRLAAGHRRGSDARDPAASANGFSGHTEGSSCAMRMRCASSGSASCR